MEEEVKINIKIKDRSSQNETKKVEKFFDVRKSQTQKAKINLKFKILSFKSILNDKILKFKNLFKIKLKFKIKNSFQISNLKFKIKNWRSIIQVIKRIRMNRIYLRKTFAVITIFAVLVTAYFQNTPQASAATFTLYQTAWNTESGTELEHTPNGSNQTEIFNYTNSPAKDANIGTQITMLATDATPNSAIGVPYQQGGFDVSGNVKSSTQITGSGDGASVELTQDTNWIQGTCGVVVRGSDSGNLTWGPAAACLGPQCATDIDSSYPLNYALVADNSQNFGSYPARQACQSIGGRLPTVPELQCIYTNSSSYGAFEESTYFTSTELTGNTSAAYRVSFVDGSSPAFGNFKTTANYVRCVKSGGNYSSSGTYTSYVDAGATARAQNLGWKTIKFTKNSSAGTGTTTMQVQVKSNDDAANAPTFNATGNCDATVTADGNVTLDVSSCTNGVGTGRYLWYKASLTASTDGSRTPLLEDFEAKAQYDGTELKLSTVQGTVTQTNNGNTTIGFNQTGVNYDSGKIVLNPAATTGVGVNASVKLAAELQSFDSDGIAQSNPSNTGEELLSITSDSNFLYLAGYDNSASGGYSQWRIEKRNKADGSLVSAFDGDGIINVSPTANQNHKAYSITNDSNYIYIGGDANNASQWRIEKRDKTTGVLVGAFDSDGIVTTASANLRALFIDANYIYATGFDWSPGNTEWRIEKRDIITGALVSAFDTDGIIQENISTNPDEAYAITVDSGHIYVAGYDQTGMSSGGYWRIEKRDKTTGALATAFDSDGIIQRRDGAQWYSKALSIAVDSNNIYVAGYDDSISSADKGRVEKRNKITGALVTDFDSDGFVAMDLAGSDRYTYLTVDANYVYAVGYDSVNGASNSQWRIEKRSITTGALVAAFDSDGVIQENPNSGHDKINSVTIDSSYVYLAGYDSVISSTDLQWRTEKRNIGNGLLISTDSYYSTGTFTSGPMNLGTHESVGNFTYTTSNQTAATSISFKARSYPTVQTPDFSSCTTLATANSTTPSGSVALTGSGSCTINPTDPYIYYQATFNTSDTTVTPSLDQVDVTYNYYPTSQTLTSPVYDSSSSGNLVNKLTWNDSGTSGTETVRFQIRSSSDSVTWSDWCGYGDTTTEDPTCTGTYYFESAHNDVSLQSNNPLRAGDNDRYFQYKVYLASAGALTPTLEDLTIEYVVNATPIVSITNSPAQATGTGTVDIAYNLQNGPGEPTDRFNAALFYTTEDESSASTLKLTAGILSTDTTLGITGADGSYLPASGYIQIDNEIIYYPYKSGSGSSWTLGSFEQPLVRAKWVTSGRTSQAATHAINAPIYAQLSTANISTVQSQSEVGIGDLKDGSGVDLAGDSVNQSYTLRWDSASDTAFGDRYEAKIKLKVSVNDDNAANQIGTAANATAFAVDTLAPQSPNIQVDRSYTDDNTDSQITLSATDANAMEYDLDYPDPSEDECSFSGDWQTYAATVNFTDAETSQYHRKVCVRFRDSVGNISATVSTQTPRTPQSFQYYDVSDPDDFRVFLSWKVPTGEEGSRGFYQYQIFNCSVDKDNPDCVPDTSGAPYHFIAQEPTNYYTDLDLLDTKKYCYFIRYAAQNASGTDYSKWSETQCVVPSSASSSVTKNVEIQFPAEPVPDAEIFANQATVHWTTVNADYHAEELPADSQVCWRVHTTPIPNWNCRSYESYEVEHALTISKATNRIYDLAPDTEYEYQVRSTTSWGKTDTADGPATFTTKNGPVIKSINVDPISNTDAYVTWTTQNKTGADLASTSVLWFSSSLDEDGNLFTPTQADCDAGEVVSHSCHLTSLTLDTQYYFYVESTANEATAQDSAEGAYYRFNTLSDNTPPTIIPDAGNPLLLTDTQAAVSWETTEKAKSWILWDTVSHPTPPYNAPSNDFDPTNTEPGHTNDNPYANYQANANSDLSHTFVMDLGALIPDTDYYYRIVAEDPSGNVRVDPASTEYSFQTLDVLTEHEDLENPNAPGTYDPIVSQYSDTEAVVYLPVANTDATSRLCYGEAAIDADDIDGGTDTCALHEDVSPGTKSHFYHLTGLDADTTYHLMTKITDSQNTDIDFTSADVTFVTEKVQVDRHEPLSEVTTPGEDDVTTGTTYALVSWQTKDADGELVAASSRISCADPDDNTFTTQDLVNLTQAHTLKLTGLTADTLYTCSVSSADDLTPANLLSSGEFTFTTEKNPEFQHDPVAQIKNTDNTLDLTDAESVTTFQPTILTDTTAVIKFNTLDADDDYANAKCQIDYRQENMEYADDVFVLENDYNANHAITIDGRIFSTKYYYTIECTDNNGESVTSQEFNFTTSEQLYTESGADALGDHTAPSISSVSSGTITGESVTIEWTTDEKANSLVQYGIKSGVYDSGGSNNDVNSDVTNFVTAHSVIINNLVPGTKYFYKVMSYDASGNIGESSEDSFTTKSASNISSIKAVSTKLGEVTITWKTGAKTTSTVEYGESTSYGETKESSSYATEHEITISGLKANTEYHFMVKGKDQDNNVYASGDNSFTPKSPPQITAVKTSSTTEHEATITFTTSAPTDALIVYTNTEDKSDTGSQGKPDLLTSHSITLKNLTSGVTYSYIITAKDYDGNASTYPATGQSSPSFTTGQDTAPPKIDQIRTDSALAQNDKVQTIISWITDELSDTALIYKEGQNSEPKEVKVSSNPTTNHIAVITIFKPGTVYFFKTKSTDLSGNSATSSDFALLTPKRKENIIQIIISNFQDIFGWAKF